MCPESLVLVFLSLLGTKHLQVSLVLSSYHKMVHYIHTHYSVSTELFNNELLTLIQQNELVKYGMCRGNGVPTNFIAIFMIVWILFCVFVVFFSIFCPRDRLKRIRRRRRRGRSADQMTTNGIELGGKIKRIRKRNKSGLRNSKRQTILKLGNKSENFGQAEHYGH